MLRRELAGLSAIRYQHPTEPCSERTIASWMRAEDEIESLRARMRRLKREHWQRGRRRGRRGRSLRDAAGRTLDELKLEVRGWQHRQHELPCRACPFLREHRAHHQELRALQSRVRAGEQEMVESQGQLARRMRGLRAVLEDLGFLEGAVPTSKGRLASRIYGENSLIVTQAIADGWLTELAPAELAAALVTVTAEDRMRDRPPP